MQLLLFSLRQKKTGMLKQCSKGLYKSIRYICDVIFITLLIMCVCGWLLDISNSLFHGKREKFEYKIQVDHYRSGML